MSSEKSVFNRMPWLAPVILLVITAVVTFGIYSWLNGHTEYTAGDGTGVYSNYLSCKASVVSAPFFDTNDATQVEHKIKVIFENSKPSELTYTLNATYGNNELAMKTSSVMHAKYNIYMGEHGFDANRLVPTFDAIDNDAIVNLYGDKDTVNSVTAPVFLLNTEEVMKFFKLSSSDVAKIYNAKGLSCVLYE